MERETGIEPAALCLGSLFKAIVFWDLSATRHKLATRISEYVAENALGGL
jgi:hypothetical protein